MAIYQTLTPRKQRRSTFRAVGADLNLAHAMREVERTLDRGRDRPAPLLLFTSELLHNPSQHFASSFSHD